MRIYPRLQIDIKIHDLFLGLCSYLVPLNRKQLEQDICSFWPSGKHVKVCFTVRTALDSLLSALNLPEGTEVIMSAVNIKDMADIIESHGLKIVPADIRVESMFPASDKIEALITDKSKILILSQLFGSVTGLEPFAKICKKHGMILIEDCAQAFCGTRYRGSPFADISLFSFGPIKSLTALGGAVAVANSRDYINKMEKAEKRYRPKGEFWFLKRILKYLLIKFASFPALFSLVIKLIILWDRDPEKTVNGLSRSFSRGSLLMQIRFKPPVHLLFLLKRRLKKNSDSRFESRRQNARIFINDLKDHVTVPSIGASFHSFWVIPILADNPSGLQKMLLKYGFDSTMADHSQKVIKKSGEKGIRLKNAEYVMSRLIYMPDLSEMKKEDKKKLINLIKSNI